MITGWERNVGNEKDKLTSLTKKEYVVSEPKGDVLDIQDDIQYSLILDSGDAHLLGGRRQVHDLTGAPVARQSELELVNDDR